MRYCGKTTTTSIHFPFCALSLALALAVTSAWPARAQMVTGAAMEDFSKSFGLSGKGWSVQQTACSLGANALWPGEEAAFTFFVKPGQPYRGPVKVDVIHYGTRGKPGDWWKPVVFKIADTSSVTLDADLPAEGVFVTVKPRIGDAFGGYALVFDLGERGRAFAATCVRVAAPEPWRIWLPTYAMDLGSPHEMTPVVFNVFKRLGVKGARTEGGYSSIRDAHVDWAMANDLTLMLTVGCGGTAREQMPLGRGRPWLNADGSMKEKVKEDLAWLPSFDPEFKRYLKQVVMEHGWPKGPIDAVELWNEPWEGVSISGWGADCLRSREIYRVMAEAVLEARQEAGVKVLIGGACSSANTRDKLFCDRTDTFLLWLDFVSIHYQPLAADPVLEPKWMQRQGKYGRVKVWDTESWVANSDDRVAAVIASMRAMSQDRTAGIYAGNVFTSQKPRINGQEYAVAQVWAAGASIAASQKFIGQRASKEILFKNGLPWVFVFEGLPARVDGERTGPVNPDDGTVVIVGDLGASYDKNRTLFRSVALAKSAQMDIADGGGRVTAWLAADDHDFYFAAKVPRLDGLIRYETRNDDEYFYPEKVTSQGKELTWPAGVRRFSYRKDFDIPSGNGKHNVQIAFHVIPPEQKAYLPFPAGTMPRFCAYFDTDYEFALNQVGEAHGGGTEIFCLQRPGMMRKHFFPRQPKAPLDGGPVKGEAKLVVKGNVLECAIPWSELPEVKARRDAGQKVKFSFRVNNAGSAFELAAGRSVSKDNPLTFHNDWSTHWANEVEFGFER